MNDSSFYLRDYLTVTFIAALTASIAAAATLVAGIPVWAMFIGWLAFYSRGMTTISTLNNLACASIGLIIGSIATAGIGLLAGQLGFVLALTIVVFCVTVIVVGLRGLPILNNLICYFLGLVAWFASHFESSFSNLLTLGSAVCIGSFAGWTSHHLPKLLTRN